MPYILPKRRAELDLAIANLIEALNDAVDGDFNYAFTKILVESYNLKNDPRYKKINEVIGLLECCKIELYRKFGAPYEDIKEAENGPV